MSAYVIYLPLVLLVVAIVVAFAFYVQLTALKSRDDARRDEAEKAQGDSQKAQKDLEVAREELTRRRAEAADLREKLNDIRSRQHRQRETDRKQKGGAEADLADQLEQAQRNIEEERNRVDVLSREARGMQEELVRVRDANRKVEEALKAAQAAVARAVAAPVPVPVPVVASVSPAASQPGPAEEEQKRSELLERQVREARRKSGEVEEELKRARSKASNASRLHLLVKNELDLFKEKMVWSEKRVVELERLLFDNKIVLPEREVAPQPRAPQLAPGVLAREAANTGGEGVVAVSADYVPEGETSSGAAESTPMPGEEGAGGETEGEAEIEAIAEASAAAQDVAVAEPERPEAVPPIRRPKSAIDARADAGAKPD